MKVEIYDLNEKQDLLGKAIELFWATWGDKSSVLKDNSNERFNYY